MRDFGYEAQQAAQRHLEAVEEAFYAEELDDADPNRPETPCESPAYGPYCGCPTCQVRETLAGAWPIIDEYADDAARVPREALVRLMVELALSPREHLTAGVIQAMVEAEQAVTIELSILTP